MGWELLLTSLLSLYFVLHDAISLVLCPFSEDERERGNIYYQERAFVIFELCTTIQNKSRQPLHSMPSKTSKSESGFSSAIAS